MSVADELRAESVQAGRHVDPVASIELATAQLMAAAPDRAALTAVVEERMGRRPRSSASSGIVGVASDAVAEAMGASS